MLDTERVGAAQRGIGEIIGRQSKKVLIQAWHNG